MLEIVKEREIPFCVFKVSTAITFVFCGFFFCDVTNKEKSLQRAFSDSERR